VHGGRYNIRLEFGVLYLASSPECAYQEKLRQVKGREDNLLPQTVASFRVRIAKCLDLLDPGTLSSLQIRREDLIRNGDFSIPRAVTREARMAGFEALLVPSATGEECRTLAVFKDRLAPPSFCVLEPESVKPFISPHRHSISV
jgi:hypothetical protein